MPTPLVQSLERSLDILEAFTAQYTELGINELSQRVNLSPATVSRLVHTLVKRGYLKQSRENKKYHLGLKFLDLTAVLHSEMDLPRIAIPILRKLRDEIKETVYVDVIDNTERVCIASVQGIHALSVIVHVGQRSPLFAGADSRMLLASLDDEEIEKYLENVDLRPYGSNTITSKEKLLEFVKKSREVGLTISINEFHEGSACVSMPIRNFDQSMVAAISVVFHERKANLDIIQSYVVELQKAAMSISEQLGYREHKGNPAQEGRSSLKRYFELGLFLKDLYV